MTYYDPSGHIAPDDNLLPEIEELLQSQKKARPRKSKRSKSIQPPGSAALEVFIVDTGETLDLTLAIETNNKISISLSAGGQVFLRTGHFNHPRHHHNPSGENIRPPHHIHFPSAKYPNIKQAHDTYAYSVTIDGGFLAALQLFCEHNNIVLQGVPIPLPRSR